MRTFLNHIKNETLEEIKTSLENLWQQMIQLSEFFQYSFVLILKRKCLVRASRVRSGESGTPSTIIYVRWSSRRYELGCDTPVCTTTQSITGTCPTNITIFRSKSKSEQYLQCSSLNVLYRSQQSFAHVSATVLTCAKFRCDRFSIFKLEHWKFLSSFEFNRNTVSWTGARTVVMQHLQCASQGHLKQPQGFAAYDTIISHLLFACTYRGWNLCFL